MTPRNATSRRPATTGTATVGRRTRCDACFTVAKARSAAKARKSARLSRKRRKAAGEEQPTWAAELNSLRAEKMRRQKADRCA